MRLYFVSYYYTISTVTFVGYGDIVGLNTLERLVAIVNEVIGVIIFSVIISKLSNIVMLID
jgi:Ion channel